MPIVVAGLALGLPFDAHAYTTTAISTLLNMIDDTTTKPSDLPKPADEHVSSYIAARDGQHALAAGDDWLYRCNGVSLQAEPPPPQERNKTDTRQETNAPIRDCEVVLAELLAAKAGKRLVLGEIGCRRWDYGNCRAEVCASGQNYVSVRAADAAEWVGKVLIPQCLARGLTGYVTNCDGPLRSRCEVLRISMGHVNASLTTMKEAASSAATDTGGSRPSGQGSGNRVPPPRLGI
ncbi:hypothetical protein KJ359_002813 [Pestalotiopsis sp. 9143b]|nr:hypothetical protein KJ359_002813 [Pestalotiopsis sp. 9143b]